MTPQDAGNAITDCPYYLVSRTSLAITAALKRGFTAAGLDNVRPGYVGVLMALWRMDGQKTIELGRAAGLEPSTMTGLIDRMERDGLVTRSLDPADRRASVIHLTDAGLRARSAVEALIGDVLDAAMASVAPEDLVILKRSLRAILASLDRLGGTE